MDLVEIVNLMNGTQRAVQLYVGKKPVLLLGSSYHHIILEHFLQDRSIRFKRMQVSSNLSIPVLKGRNYHVVGMGNIRIYTSFKVCTGMSGENLDYKIGIDIEHLEKVKETLRIQGWQCI